MAYDDIYRIATSRDLAVDSVGGAVASSTVFGSQTYAVMLSWPGSTSSTAGVRVAIIDAAGAAVSSTQGALLPPSWVQVYRCTPGQRVSVISNDAGKPNLNIVELTK